MCLPYAFLFLNNKRRYKGRKNELKVRSLAIPGVNFINILQQLLRAQISKAQNWLTSCLYIVHFWDLRLQKLLVK